MIEDGRWPAPDKFLNRGLDMIEFVTGRILLVAGRRWFASR